MPEQVTMNAPQIERRANQAQGFLEAAKRILQLWDDTSRYEEDTVGSVVGSLAVLSGIASADVITGGALGYRNAFGYGDAPGLLKQAGSSEAAALLDTLLSDKSRVQYSTAFTSRDKAKTMLDSAQKLYRLALRSNAAN